MTTDEVKERLRAYRRIRNECEGLKNRIERKRSDMHYLQAVVSDSTSRGRGVSDSVERAVEKIDGLIRYYAERVAECEEAEQTVLEIIGCVDDPDGRSILFLRYIEGERFEDIADALHISNGTMWSRYNTALKNICSELE